MARRWMHSPPFDLALIIGPPLLSALAVMAFPCLQADSTPAWGYFATMVCIDIGHVYASLFRTYFDAEERRRRPRLYFGIPALVWAVGSVLYGIHPMTFWRAFTYLSVFHFVRQQYGFMRIYQRLHHERSRLDAWIDRCAIYATMLYPLVYWHADPARQFAWFVAGDFVRINAALSPVAGWLYGSALAAFGLRQLWVYAAERRANWGKIGIIASTAAAWYIGIIHFNSDFAFTITNVVSHGIPYYAVVWLYGRRKWGENRSWLEWLHRPAVLSVGAFLAISVAFAYLEDGAWNILISRDYLSLYGNITVTWARFAWQPSAWMLRFLVPVLVIPPATHYLLDAWIWKLDDSNPGIRYYLLKEGEKP